MENEKVTIYSTSEFFGNVVKYEGYLIEHGRKKYAQYENAPFVTFKPRRKRNAVRIIKGYKPYLLILKGWDNPNPQEMCGKVKQEGNVIIKESTYSSFDDNYKIDFDNMIDEYREKFIADYRDKKYDYFG